MIGTQRLAGIAVAVLILIPVVSLAGIAGKPPPPPPPPAAKYVTFGICEDYDKGQDLAGIALDFQLCNQLEVDTMRVSFGWDDYEPARGQYDFAWLHDFCNLAASYGIKLRPYICYTPAWAGDGNWNSPPSNFQDWYDFCYNLALAMRNHTNIVSYEIWNEENDMGFWWGGNVEQYKELLRQGVTAIRAADPGRQILLGGLAWADWDFFNPIASAGYHQYYDVVPIHCYFETWPANVHVEDWFDAQWKDWFVPTNKQYGDRPIWNNEMGYSTLNRTEEAQANFMCRSISHFISDPEIEHISWYEIKDLDPSHPAIGDENNYHLGITTFPSRAPKKAFHTFDMITDLLDKKTITPADADVSVTVVSGRKSRRFYTRLFKLSDGNQVLFVYDKTNTVTVNLTLKTPGSQAYKYDIYTNTPTVHASFDGTTIAGVALTPGNVQVFRIAP